MKLTRKTEERIRKFLLSIVIFVIISFYITVCYIAPLQAVFVHLMVLVIFSIAIVIPWLLGNIHITNEDEE